MQATSTSAATRYAGGAMSAHATGPLGMIRSLRRNCHLAWQLAKRDGVDAVFGDAEFFRADRPVQAVRRYNSARFSPKRIAWGWMPAHPAMFLRREVFERYGPFRTDYRIAGDFEFIARAFWPDKLRYCHLPEVLVRMRTGGVSTGGWRNTILLNREVLRACRENGIPTNSLTRIIRPPSPELNGTRSRAL